MMRMGALPALLVSLLVIAPAAQSSGNVTVPRVVGRDWRAAELSIRATGLRPVIRSVRSSRPRGTVVAQHPVAHTHATRGSTVRLAVANAAVTVPGVVGLQRADAVERLAKLGLRPHAVTVKSLRAVGTVVGQHPARRAAAVLGDRVSIFVSGGPGP
jgi:beta-lactam-binding protein with PASTA domain